MALALTSELQHRDVGESHGSATEGGSASVRSVRGRQDRAARSPDVNASAIVREGGALVGGVCASDSDCIWNICWREVASVGFGISCCNYHSHTSAHCRIN